MSPIDPSLPASEGLSVLIADDSALMQERLKMMLEMIPGVSVVAQVVDAEAAEIAVGRLKPDVVILDLRLPGSGINALQHIKSQLDPPVIIMFTAFATPIHRQKCLAFGADYFYDKTTDLQDFQTTLKTIASQKWRSQTA